MNRLYFILTFFVITSNLMSGVSNLATVSNVHGKRASNFYTSNDIFRFASSGLHPSFKANRSSHPALGDFKNKIQPFYTAMAKIMPTIIFNQPSQKNGSIIYSHPSETARSLYAMHNAGKTPFDRYFTLVDDHVDQCIRDIGMLLGTSNTVQTQPLINSKMSDVFLATRGHYNFINLYPDNPYTTSIKSTFWYKIQDNVNKVLYSSPIPSPSGNTAVACTEESSCTKLQQQHNNLNALD